MTDLRTYTLSKECQNETQIDGFYSFRPLIVLRIITISSSLNTDGFYPDRAIDCIVY